MKGKHYKLILLIPCFKEENNLEVLIKNIAKLEIDLAIVFIFTLEDANEKDVVRTLELKTYINKDIFYITNYQRGIGLAYKQGLKYAIDNFDFDFLCTMDADNSHHPCYLPELLKKANESDVTIASRYLKNNKAEEEGVHKYDLLSHALNVFVGYFLPFRIYDSTSGYKIYSRNVLLRMDIEKLISKGFFIQLEILFELLRKGYVISEVPYSFLARRLGFSKRRIFDICEYIFLYIAVINFFLFYRIVYYLKSIIWLLRLTIKLLKFRFVSKTNYKSPFRLMLKITSGCNFTCKVCGIWKEGKNKYISKEQQVEIFDRYKNDIFLLTLTGGEPFLDRGYLADLIDLAAKKCSNLRMISINTNGFFTENIVWVINYVLQRNEFIRLIIGLSFVPDKNWGADRTGNIYAFQQYHNTYKEIKKLRKIYGSRLNFYRIFTINGIKDVELVRNQTDEMWLNFTEVSSFYNNSDTKDIEIIDFEEKKEIVSYFLNNKKLSFLNFLYLKHFVIFLNGGRKGIVCYAGKNRIYIDDLGRECVCSRLNCNENKSNNCVFCWTPCEAVFDIIERPLYLVSLFLKWVIKF